MAQQGEGQFSYRRARLIKTEPLGTGSYGAVYKVILDDHLPCAGKILHPTLFQSNDPGAMTVMRRFQQECSFLSAIRHPNIVQYLGSYQDQGTQLPVLLMELMDDSLTRFLEQSHKPLPYHTQVNICHDIALALAYLHSNRMIHRDLSSNNVLLIGAGNRAKVTDFGMAKISGVNRSSMTMCPGTQVYMSPETLDDPPVYTKKLDSFSVGVLSIQIITRKFPDPGPRTKKVRHMLQVVIPETERRKSHIDLIDPTHPLLPIAIKCLNDIEQGRPSAQELCQWIAALKQASQYRDSAQQAQERSRQVSDLIGQLQELQKDKEPLQQELQREKKKKRSFFSKSADKEDRELQQEKEELQRKKQQLQLQQGKEELQHEKEELQHEKQQLQRENKELQHEKEELQGEKQQLQRENEELQHEKEELQGEKQQLQQQIRRFQLQQVSQERDCAIRIQKITREKYDVERQLQELNQQLANKDKQIRKLQRQQAQEGCRPATHLIDKLQQDLQQREEVYKENELLQHKLQMKEREMQQITQEKDCTIQAKEKREEHKMQQEQEKLQCEKEELQCEKGELQCEKEELQREKEELQREKGELQREKGELQREKGELHREKEELQHEKEELQQELQLQPEVRRLQLQQVSQEKDCVIEARDNQIRKLQQQQEECDREIKDLHQELQVSIQDKDAAILSAQQRIQKVTREKDHAIQAKESQLQELKQHLANRDNQIRKLQQQHRECDREIQDLHQELQVSIQDKDAAILSAQQRIQKVTREKDHAIQAKESQIQELKQHLANRDNQIRKLQQQHRECDQQIQDLRLQMWDKDAAIVLGQQRRQQITSSGLVPRLSPLRGPGNEAIQAKDRQLRELKKRLTDSEQVTSEFQQSLQQGEEKIHKLQEYNKQLQQKLQEKLTLRWKTSKTAPCTMMRGSATVCGNMAYFRPHDSNQVHSYNSDKEKWSTLPVCPTYHFTLTVVNGLVTAVGGSQGALRIIEKLTNTLFSLVENGGRWKWEERLEPMPTKRKLAAVVCSGKTLVVGGGKGEGGLVFTTLNTVEVMNIHTQQWSTADSLPYPLYDATATVCGDRVYLGGGMDESGNHTKSVFTCSLNTLLKSAKTRNHPVRHTIPDNCWDTTADLPVERSTCVTLNGQLLAVGGWDLRNKITSNTVYSYSVETKSFDFISQMPTCRQHCLVAVLPGNKVMVVGGRSPFGSKDDVEIATLQ